MTQHFVVKPGRNVRLADFDPSGTPGISRQEAESHMTEDLEYLWRLQELLFVSGANSVLVLLQGTDTSGKDGTIRHVFGGVSPLGCQVAAFGLPSQEELAHDYLWRIHKQCPARGTFTIFNRSHYESVLVEGVHKIATQERIRERYNEINAFERMLAREGTILLKFYLHISKAEQEERLKERISEPDKNWKVNPGDWEDRKHWDEFQRAYEEMLNRTSTEWAPWTVVPSDKKWFRNYVVAHHITEALGEHEDEWRTALRTRGEKQMAAMRQWQDANKSGK